MKPKEKTPHSAATLAKFAAGKSFEQRFKAQFEPAIDVQHILQRDTYSIGAAYTKALLAHSSSLTLFEACFIHNKTLVMTDILVKENSALTIYEIKNYRELKEVLLWDASLQYYVCKSAYPELASFKIVMSDGENGYVIQDITSIVAKNMTSIAETLAAQLQLLQEAKEPYIEMGEQCTSPYTCEFIAYCSKVK